MATTTISGSTTRNNNGTILLGGNVSATGPVTNAPDKTVLGAGATPPPSPKNSANVGTTKAVSAGNFAKLASGSYVVYGGDITTTLAGVSNTEIANTASDEHRKRVNQITSRRTVRITSWDYRTGTPTYHASNPSNDSFGADHAADNTTKAIPGELVYRIGKPVPTQADYPARTL